MMQLNIHDDYKSVVEGAQESANQNLQKLLSRLFFQTPEGNVFHMDRADLESFEPVEGGTLLHKRDQSSEMVLETPEQVEAILDGTPNATILNGWAHSLSHLRADEQRSIRQAVDTHHQEFVKQNKLSRTGIEVRNERALNLVRTDEQKAEDTISKIEQDQAQRGFWANISARKDGTLEQESLALAEAYETLERLRQDRTNTLATTGRWSLENQEEAQHITETYSTVSKHLDEVFAHQNSAEGMQEDIDALTCGFSAVMKAYNAGEARLAALAGGGETPDDDDFERELELEISAPLWKNVIDDRLTSVEAEMKTREEDIAQRKRDAQEFSGFVEEQERSARLQAALDLAARRDRGLNDEDRRYLDLATQLNRSRDDFDIDI